VSNKDDKSKFILAEPELESPPRPELPNPESIGALFPEDSLPIVASKLLIMEILFQLVTRDCKFQEFMREALIAVMKAVKSEAGSILEVDHVNQTLFFRAVVGQSSDRLCRFIVPMGKGVVGHVAEARQPLVVNAVEENRVYLKSIQDAVGFEARNLVAVPLMVRGRIYGVLELLNRVGEENYTPADVELLTYLAGIVAKAIEIRMMLAWKAQSSGSSDQEVA
jgi:GAF domain-containing protein